MSEGAATLVFVTEACTEISFDGGFGDVAAHAWSLTLPPPDERGNVLHAEAARVVDPLLTRVAHAHGALEIAIGEGLLAQRQGHRTMLFGYAGIGDYARERLGINGNTAAKMMHRARKLRDRPHLREAVWLGHVSPRKADAILPVARDDAEEEWVARARTGKMLALESAARAAGALPAEPDEKWERICVLLSAEDRPVWDEAMELAGPTLENLAAPKWQRIEAAAMEFLGGHAPPDDDDGGDGILHAPVSHWLTDLKAHLATIADEWSFIDEVPPAIAPVPSVPVTEDPHLLDEELRRLARLRERWDEVFGHLAFIFNSLRLWQVFGFASFEHYCAERLETGVRAVEQRIWLERMLSSLPRLRNALRDGHVNYEQARAIASHATDQTVDEWIHRAQGMTCIALRRQIEAEHDAQICARGELELRVPARVHGLLGLAIRAARKAEGRWISNSTCLRRIAEHCIGVWKPMLKQRNTVRTRVVKRDKGLCQVPGCSRPVAHVHHIIPRAQGGADDPWNLVSLCVAHHLHGIHDGYIHVSGKAPDQLHWELGVRLNRKEVH